VVGEEATKPLYSLAAEKKVAGGTGPFSKSEGRQGQGKHTVYSSNQGGGEGGEKDNKESRAQEKGRQ